jgi:tartrate-resistant acid phosphatase type 5
VIGAALLGLCLLVGPALAGEASDAELGLVFFGDGGTAATGPRRVAEAVGRYCATARCDFLALLGDNIYPDGVGSVDDPQWQEKIERPLGQLGLVIRPALGNHDHHGDPDAQVAYSETSGSWDMPGRYYRFEQGPAAFFVLDTERMGWRQRCWLARGLRRSSATWTVVYGHHPLLSYGRHGSDPALRRRIAGLVQRHADFYLSGHDHSQQVLDSGGTIHVVMGSGGSRPTPVSWGPETRFAASALGFGHLLLREDSALLTVVGADDTIRFQDVFWVESRGCSTCLEPEEVAPTLFADNVIFQVPDPLATITYIWEESGFHGGSTSDDSLSELIEYDNVFGDPEFTPEHGGRGSYATSPGGIAADKGAFAGSHYSWWEQVPWDLP